MPVQKDIEEGIFQTTLSNEENNDNTHDNVNTINNNEASTQSSMSSPSDNISTTPYDDISHTLPPPVEDTDQSTLIANHLQNTSYDHTETEPGYTQPQPAVGLVQIHDDNIAPLPPIAALESITDSSGIAVGKKIQGKIEQIEDSTAPSLPTTAFDNSDIKRKIALETRIDTINDTEDAPIPFNIATLDLEEDAKIKSRQLLNPRDERGRDSSAIPTSGDLENDTGLYTTITTPYSLRNRDGSGVRGIVGNETVEDNTNSSSLVESGDNNANHVAVDRAGNDMTTTLEQGQSDSIPIIPEAFLVEESEDGVVFDAEPWLPWWKRKRFVGFLLLFAACVLAIAIGVGTHVGSRNTNVLAAELTPTISPAPTMTLEPSSSPSECALTVSTNVQKLDMQVDKPFDTKIAIDKSNAVVVTREEGTNNVHIMFYLLSESRDRWERNNQYIEDYGETTLKYGEFDPDAAKISVALSGRDALVGFPFTGSGLVFAFKQNELGVWEKKEDTLQMPESRNEYSLSGFVYNFGYSVGIGDDVACVMSGNELHVFQNDGNEWKETQRRFNLPHQFYGCLSAAKECFISGDTIVLEVDDWRIDVFKYDQYSESYKRNQDSLTGSHGSVSFDKDHLVYTGMGTDPEEDCFGYTDSFSVYHQQDITQAHHQPYVLQQQVNFTDDYGGCLPSASISHDKDLLVVGGINQTHIYVLDNNGSWEEQLTLDNRYRQYRVSERSILASKYNKTTNKDEVYYFNIEACASTPTQMPSLSTAPSSSLQPSLAPSIGGTQSWTSVAGGYSNTLSPTSGIYRYYCSNVSISQTANTPPVSSPDNTCYSIDVVVAFDDKPQNSVWDIQRVNQFGDNDVLKVSRGTSDDIFKLRKESICLRAGVYQFTMHDDTPKGGGISYPGYYNVLSDGDLIVKGRELFCNETTTFTFPLTAVPSMMPSETTSPTFNTYSPASPSTTQTQTPWRQTPFPTDPESTGSSPRPQNITLAGPDSVSVSAGDEIFVSVLDNDIPEQTLSINSITTPATNGSCAISLDWKEVVYIPNPGFTGFDTCVYEACDSVSACDTATLTVNVTSQKIDFVCPPVSYIGCTAADLIRPEDDCSEVGEPCPGQYIEYCCRDACRNYCTAKNFAGLSNGDTPSPVSSPDSDISPVAHPDSANLSTTTSEYGLAFVSVLDNDTPTAGLDGETLLVRSIAAQASNGFCSISLDAREVVYEPDPGFTGLDSCVYEACDSILACDTAMLTIIVTSQTTEAIASPDSPMPPPQTSPSACEDITTKKDCTKSTNNCIWDTTVEGGGPMCVSSEA